MQINNNKNGTDILKIEMNSAMCAINIYNSVDSKFQNTDFSVIDNNTSAEELRYIFYSCCFIYSVRDLFIKYGLKLNQKNVDEVNSIFPSILYYLQQNGISEIILNKCQNFYNQNRTNIVIDRKTLNDEDMAKYLFVMSGDFLKVDEVQWYRSFDWQVRKIMECSLFIDKFIEDGYELSFGKEDNFPDIFIKAIEYDKSGNYKEALKCYIEASKVIPEYANLAIHCLEHRALSDERIKADFIIKGPAIYADCYPEKDIIREKVIEYTNLISKNRFSNYEDFINTLRFYKKFNFIKDYKNSYIDYLNTSKDYAGCVNAFESDFDYIDNKIKDYDFELRILEYIVNNTYMKSPERIKAEKLLSINFELKMFKGWTRKNK